MNRIVVTVAGANGFIGKAVVEELLARGYQVQALIHNNADGLIESDYVQYYKIESDVSRLKTLLKPCRYFFNFIWGGMKGPAMGDYEIQLNNIQLTIEMVRLSAYLGAKYIQAASLIEFEAFNNAFVSSSAVGKTHIYGASKFAAHVYSKYEALQGNIEYSCGLITNAYGPGERNPRLITNTMKKIKNGEIPKFSSGTQLYDFVYISDVARAFVLIAEKGLNKTYIIGSGNPKPLRSFLETINELIAPDIQFEYGAADVPVDFLNETQFSIESLVEDTGYIAKVGFEEGIKNTFNQMTDEQ